MDFDIYCEWWLLPVELAALVSSTNQLHLIPIGKSNNSLFQPSFKEHCGMSFLSRKSQIFNLSLAKTFWHECQRITSCMMSKWFSTSSFMINVICFSCNLKSHICMRFTVFYSSYSGSMLRSLMVFQKKNSASACAAMMFRVACLFFISLHLLDLNNWII